MILDEIRARYPHLGVAIYALEPGQPVTVETYAPDGGVFSFTGASADAALAKAFPEMMSEEPTALETEAPAPEANVFD